MHSMQLSTWDNCALADLRCKVDGVTTCSGTADVTIKCISSQHMQLEGTFHCSVSLYFLLGSSQQASVTAEWGHGCICDPMFLCKSHSVKPLWYPLRLFSLIPFHNTRRVLPTNNIAHVHCVQTKGIISRLWLSHQTPMCSYSQLKRFFFISVALCIDTTICATFKLSAYSCPWDCHFHVDLTTHLYNSHFSTFSRDKMQLKKVCGAVACLRTA